MSKFRIRFAETQPIIEFIDVVRDEEDDVVYRDNGEVLAEKQENGRWLLSPAAGQYFGQTGEEVE